MAHILVIGGGLAGCTVSWELAQRGHKITLVEKSGEIGGRVREYGCKATERCNNCGLCLAGGLWGQVEESNRIAVYKNAVLSDLMGVKGDFSAVIKMDSGYEHIDEVSFVVVAVGFGVSQSAHVQISGGDGTITGLELEKIIKGRRERHLLEKEPSSVAFIQCFGSRDKKEHGLYCSRVCCGYSTRAAKLIRKYYPQSRISFFYMELQEVVPGDYFAELVADNIEFIKCRPLKIKNKEIIYENSSAAQVSRRFDLIVLSEGIHPPEDADLLAELCRLNQDAYGFLKYVESGEKTGIYIIGCAGGPAKIEEVYGESVAVAKQIANL